MSEIELWIMEGCMAASVELYEALLEALPKKQAAALQAAKRWMDAS